MKKALLSLTLIFMGFILYGCNISQPTDIITTMYPQYDITNQIVGDKLTVSLLSSPGVEIHDFEPTSKQIISIKNSKLFLFTSLELDTWIKDVDKIVGEHTLYLDLSKSYVLEEHDHDDHKEVKENHNHHHDHDDHDHASLHFWTDPTTFMQMIDAILEKIIMIDTSNKDFYIKNAESYKSKISSIHHDIEHYFHDKESSIYYAGHNAIEAFGDRYNLNIIALSDSIKPDADLTSQQIVALTNKIKELNVSFLFTEELQDPKVAKAIQTSLGTNYSLTLLEFHGYHNISKKDFDNHVSYFDLLNRNFENLKIALGGSHANN